MSKLRKAILIIGILVIAVAASLGTALALYATGTVKTDPIELEFKLKEPQEAKVYDGTPLKLSRVNFDDPLNSDIELSKGSLQPGHTVKVEFVGSQTDVGTTMSDANIKIYDKNGFNVTNDYSIKVIGAQLTVVQKTISVELPAQKVVYNGSKVQFNQFKISEDSDGGLCNGHRIYGSTNAELLNVGDTLPEDLTPLIFDAAGNDVTANYKIEDFKYDGIEVVKRSVTVRPVSYEKVYDGVVMYADEIEFVEGSLVDGQTVEFEINDGYNNKLRDVGETKTEITSLKIYYIAGEEKVDVTENYEFNLQEYNGLLKVTPRPLTVVAKSAEFVYNGKEQSLRDETDAEAVEGLADGEELYSVSYISSRTNVGVSANKIGEVNLKSSLDNYKVTLIDGTLEITPYELTVTTYSAEKYYDGDPLYDEHSTCNLTVDGHEIVIAEDNQFPTIINVGEIPNAYEVSVVDKNNGREDCTSNYAITYDYGTLTVKRLPVKVTLKNGEDDREKVNYDSKTHEPTLGLDGANSAYFAVAPILKEGEEVAKFTLDYTAFDTVAETRAMSDAGTYYYSVKFKDRVQEDRKLYSNYELFVPESGALEILPLPVTVTLKKYNNASAFTYSGKPVKIEVTEAIENIKTGSGASLPADVQLSTLLDKEDFTVVKREIRVDGENTYTVPADEIIDAGENYIYTVKIADGSVAKNFKVSIEDLQANESGVNITVKAMPVTITLADVARTYNGEVQTVDISETLIKIEKTEPSFVDDDITETGLTAGSLAVVYGTGDRINVKDYTFEVKIADTKKKLQSNYALTIKSANEENRNNAKLTIGKFRLEVTTDTCEFLYDGNDRSSGKFTYGALANAAHTVKLKTAEEALRTVKNVGDTEKNTFDVDIYSGENQTEENKVSNNYDIKYIDGTLSVKPLPITITTGSEQKIYDGRALRKVTATTDVKLATGQRLSYPSVNVPELTNVGKKDNEFECDIVEGNDSVKNNYDIKYVYGTLEVTRCEITVKTYDAEKDYDGTPLSNNKITIEDAALAEKYKAQPRQPFSIINAGSVDNVFECKILTKNDLDVTGNFDIKFADDCGTLTINPIAATITLSDFSNGAVDMTYDGKQKKFEVKDAVTVIIDGDEYKVDDSREEGKGLAFAKTDFEIVYSSAIIDAGSYQYSVRFTDEAFANNFTIEDIEEQLTCTVRVKQKKLNLQLNSYTDGLALVFDNRVQELEIQSSLLSVLDDKYAQVDNKLISVDDFIIVYPEPLINAGDYKYT
ncbi:MAG: hypothetical protein K2K04_01975, partial [Clostridia bacterium]|nr:hypothetical protein [Clostridia bacterium]